MTKADLVEGLTQKTHLNKVDAEGAINAIFEEITYALSMGDRVVISGFGTFGITVREVRTGRNPKTGESIEIPTIKSARFKAGKQLKESLNGAPPTANQNDENEKNR
jgi:nucleoid DNA-binding protein